MATAMLLLALLVLSACGQDYPQNTFNPAGDNARTAGDLFFRAFWIAVIIFVLVEGLLVFAAIRYRARRRDEMPVQVHGNTRLEIVWTVIPALLLLFIGVPTIQGIFQLSRRPAEGAVEVRVIAHQWWWEFQYGDANVVTANELFIPVGRPVHLSMEAEDTSGGQEAYGLTPPVPVIHSFWPARLAGTQDVVPGRVTEMSFTADAPGVYPGQCKEFCGISHANMRFRVVVQTQEEFDRWLRGQQAATAEPQPGSLAEEGAGFFQGFTGFDGRPGSCLACHAIEPGKDSVAPNLSHFASRETFASGMFPITDQNLARWLRNPGAMKAGAKMPNYHLSDQQIEALVAYLRTLE